MTISEKELIRQLKHGEDKAYRYLYDVYYEMLCRVAYEYLKDDFLAETIVGDTIFNFYEKRLTIEIQSSLRAYFVRAVRNRCISYLRLSHVSKETKLQPSDDLLESEAICHCRKSSTRHFTRKRTQITNIYSIEQLLTNVAQFSK